MYNLPGKAVRAPYLYCKVSKIRRINSKSLFKVLSLARFFHLRMVYTIDHSYILYEENNPMKKQSSLIRAPQAIDILRGAGRLFKIRDFFSSAQIHSRKCYKL